MIIILKKGASATEVENLKSLLESKNIIPHVSEGHLETIIGCVGDISHLDPGVIEAMDSVETVRRIQEPYKAANRKFHPDDTVIDCSGVKIGGGAFSVIAGPCSVESEEQIVGIAKAVKAAGATMLRGGAFKPRTSPYAFQGMGEDGIKLLQLAKKETGLPIVTELMDFKDIELFNDVDVIQIGARNMQNFNLLRRNTLDLGVVTLLHKLSHLPVVIDPSHATGHSWMVSSVAVAAAAIGADGLIIEVHNDPPHAKCDGAQSQTPEMFAKTLSRVNKVREALISESDM